MISPLLEVTCQTTRRAKFNASSRRRRKWVSRKKLSRGALLMGPCKRAGRGCFGLTGSGDTLWDGLSSHWKEVTTVWHSGSGTSERIWRTWQLLIKAESQDPPSGPGICRMQTHPRRFWRGRSEDSLRKLCHCSEGSSLAQFWQICTDYLQSAALPSFTPQFRKWRDYRLCAHLGVI